MRQALAGRFRPHHAFLIAQLLAHYDYLDEMIATVSGPDRCWGVGKVWQVTACDAATSYGVAAILPTLTPPATAAFLRHTLMPLFRRAGWPVQRVLTDRGNEFKAAFDEACDALGIRHTRTQPRHAWTNGFVERLQGTILNEHWRVVFRRRYFTRRRALDRTLQSFLRFYNFDRPHHGYRVRGRTPAALFHGPVAVRG